MSARSGRRERCRRPCTQRAKDEEISQIRREHYRADARRAVVDELGAHGVTEEGRQERILRHIDLDATNPAEDGSPYFGTGATRWSSRATCPNS